MEAANPNHYYQKCVCQWGSPSADLGIDSAIPQSIVAKAKVAIKVDLSKYLKSTGHVW